MVHLAGNSRPCSVYGGLLTVIGGLLSQEDLVHKAAVLVTLTALLIEVKVFSRNFKR